MSALPARRQLVFLFAYLVILAAISALLVSTITAGQDRRTLLREIQVLEEFSAHEVEDHRAANQADHDCIVALALLLADPARDRTAQVVPPSICRVSPANTANIEAEEPR